MSSLFSAFRKCFKLKNWYHRSQLAGCNPVGERRVTTVGKSGELGKLLAGKCWYLEGNFEILREIVHFCTQKHIKLFKFGGLLARKLTFFQAVRVTIGKMEVYDTYMELWRLQREILLISFL